MRRTNTVDTATRPAVAAKTAAVLATASSNPASAGPTKAARLSIVLATAFAAVNSDGVRASDGVKAA
jgi:hypothetical protein